MVDDSTKHTPWPWRVSKDVDTRGRPGWRIDSDTRSLMAWAAWPSVAERDSDEAEATIRIMAAAPKLLAALKECLWCMDHDHEQDQLGLPAHHNRTVDARRQAADAIALTQI